MSTIVMDISRVDEDISNEEKYRKLLSKNAEEYISWMEKYDQLIGLNAGKSELEEVLDVLDYLESKRKELSKLYLDAIKKK